MTEPTRRDTLRAAGIMGVGMVGVGGMGGAASAQAGGTRVNSWSCSHHHPGTEGVSAEGFEDQTVRQVVHTSAGGGEVRLRLANTFGEQEFVADRVTLGLRDDGAAVRPESLTEVAFGGSPGATVPVGERVTSDAVGLEVPPDHDVVVSFYTSGATGPTSWHNLGKDAAYTAAGDATGNDGPGPFSGTSESYFFLDGLDVMAENTEGTIVCFGDSITNGAGSSTGSNATYPDHLFRRIAESDVLQKSVVNAGINGNRLLNDSVDGYQFGPSGLSRFDRDALAQSNVTDVILLEGVNDIIHSEASWFDAEAVTADEIIDGMDTLITRCHDAGVRIVGGTITPFGESGLWGDAPEQKRQTVNEWIRTEADFDGVADFAAYIADPSDPTIILSQYDSGDGLHPNDRGYRAMALGVDLYDLTDDTRPTTEAPTSTTATSATSTTRTTTDTLSTTAGGGDGGSIPGFGVGAGVLGLGAAAAIRRWRRRSG